MKHLFLTSVDITGFLKYIDKSPSELKVFYTPTAAEPYENKLFIDEDRRQLHEAGVNFEEFNLKEIDKQDADATFKQLFQDVDVLIVGGGNVFYLLQESLRTGFDEVVKRLVKSGVWYVGASAGAVIAGSTIEPLAPMDEPSIASDLQTYDGFGLVDFVIIPHFANERFKESAEAGVAICKGKGLEYKAITNEESILVQDTQIKVVTKEITS